MTPIRIAIRPRFCDWCEREFVFERWYKIKNQSLLDLRGDADRICGECKARMDKVKREEDEQK